jgi:hypothetical protein
MRYALMAAAGLFTAIGFLASGNGRVTNAQQPAAQDAAKTKGGAEISPKVLAFLKPVEVASEDSELQKKLKERHNVAVALLQERISEYKKGTRELSLVFEAAKLTADAKLELADKPEARIAVLEQTLEMAKVVEDHLEQQLKKGFGSKGDLERARLARLSVEIELLRAKPQN